MTPELFAPSPVALCHIVLSLIGAAVVRRRGPARTTPDSVPKPAGPPMTGAIKACPSEQGKWRCNQLMAPEVNSHVYAEDDRAHVRSCRTLRTNASVDSAEIARMCADGNHRARIHRVRGASDTYWRPPIQIQQQHTWSKYESRSWFAPQRCRCRRTRKLPTSCGCSQPQTIGIESSCSPP